MIHKSLHLNSSRSPWDIKLSESITSNAKPFNGVAPESYSQSTEIYPGLTDNPRPDDPAATFAGDVVRLMKICSVWVKRNTKNTKNDEREKPETKTELELKPNWTRAHRSLGVGEGLEGEGERYRDFRSTRPHRVASSMRCDVKLIE